MKIIFGFFTLLACSIFSVRLSAQTSVQDAALNTGKPKHLFIDVHRFGAGNVKFKDVAKAHAKDLATEKKYGVDFLKFWVDEKNGLVYCLSSAPDSASIRKTHADAHGLLPALIYEVSEGREVNATGRGNFFLDVHQLGAGNVNPAAVAAAHKKDLAVEGKYGVNFINYWVDEKSGVVVCLSEAKDSASVINTHREAHGLVPAYVVKIKQGQ